MQRRQPNARGEGEHLRAQLVAAASELLLTTQSIALPSLRAVARACAVSPAAVYLHFDSRRALVTAVIDAQFAQLRDSIHATAASVASTSRVRAFVDAYVEWGLAHPGGYQLMFESADQLGIDYDPDDENWSLVQEAADAIAGETTLSAEESRVMAFRLWATVHGFVSLRLHKPDAAWPTSLAEDVTDALSRLAASAR
jgi:AcrR family transcriptional regulator